MLIVSFLLMTLELMTHIFLFSFSLHIQTIKACKSWQVPRFPYQGMRRFGIPRWTPRETFGVIGLHEFSPLHMPFTWQADCLCHMTRSQNLTRRISMCSRSESTFYSLPRASASGVVDLLCYPSRKIGLAHKLCLWVWHTSEIWDVIKTDVA